jgi:hypothetical protein
MSERISNIGNIVDSVINQMQEYGLSGSDRAWLLNIATSFYQDRLRGVNMPSVITMRFPVTMTTRIWPIPSHYIRYTKIGYKNQNSHTTYILGLNEDIDLTEPIASCAQPIETNPSVDGGFWFSGFGVGFGASNWVQPLYGVGGGFSKNYYRVDFENNCIRFSESLPVGEAFIEFLSAGKDVNEGTIVLLAYRASMEAWLIKRVCELKPKVMALARNVYAEFTRDAFARMWDANYLANGLTPDEMMSDIYRASGFAIR